MPLQEDAALGRVRCRSWRSAWEIPEKELYAAVAHVLGIRLVDRREARRLRRSSHRVRKNRPPLRLPPALGYSALLPTTLSNEPRLRPGRRRRLSRPAAERALLLPESPAGEPASGCDFGL